MLQSKLSNNLNTVRIEKGDPKNMSSGFNKFKIVDSNPNNIQTKEPKTSSNKLMVENDSKTLTSRPIKRSPSSDLFRVTERGNFMRYANNYPVDVVSFIK
jgi:hypothetical protein